MLGGAQGRVALAEIATQPQIKPNLLGAWKADFLENASLVFDRNRGEDERASSRLGGERRRRARGRLGSWPCRLACWKKRFYPI